MRRCQGMATCRRARRHIVCQQQSGLGRYVKKRVSFLTGPRAKRHEEMARDEGLRRSRVRFVSFSSEKRPAKRTSSPKGTDPGTENLSPAHSVVEETALKAVVAKHSSKLLQSPPCPSTPCYLLTLFHYFHDARNCSRSGLLTQAIHLFAWDFPLRLNAGFA